MQMKASDRMWMCLPGCEPVAFNRQAEDYIRDYKAKGWEECGPPAPKTPKPRAKAAPKAES